MARNIKPKHKICRLYGEKLCDSPKCPVTKRNYPSGQHGQDRKRAKTSGYGKQLREKQKVKGIYGILERQFANYVVEASKKTGDSSKIFVTYLESRLDNVIYRAGLGSSRAQARQLVRHGLIAVNGKKVDLPSFRVKVGDVFTIYETKKNKPVFAGMSEKLAKVEAPAWLSIDAKELKAKVLNTPVLDRPNFNANVIIEFYSR
ncbi:MAG: 30S ribosomal protein S4 [bacterium]|nr:30S ribosomal protein S4 [bacterium]